MPRPVQQLALPGLENHAVLIPADEPAWLALAEAPAEAPAVTAAAPEGQLALFDALPLLRHDLAAALGRADFELTLELRARLADEYGAQAARPYHFLTALDAGLWRLPARDVLSAWERIAGEVEPEALRACARRAVHARLIALHGAAPLVAQAPQALPEVVAALLAANDEPAAHGLLRDALLGGRALEPLAFDAPALRELLAEDLAPRWLACLGALRRLWPLTSATTPDGTQPDDDDARALLFWRELGVARDPGASAGARQAARRRMKQLHPELHALALQRLT